jgi:hypothetical protein
MKYLKVLGLAAVAAMAMMAFAAGSASATTLEVGGVTTDDSVTITASLASGESAILKDTAGFSKNTCTVSHVHGTTTSPFTGDAVTGDIETLTFTGCTRTVTVHDPGKLEVVWTSDTNGTVYSEEAQVTVGSAIGTLNCETDETTHLGDLTGVASGHATLHVNAVIDCGIISSAKWEATYTITSPDGLGVSP